MRYISVNFFLEFGPVVQEMSFKRFLFRISLGGAEPFVQFGKQALKETIL